MATREQIQEVQRCIDIIEAYLARDIPDLWSMNPGDHCLEPSPASEQEPTPPET
jgi:hypothetical protein